MAAAFVILRPVGDGFDSEAPAEDDFAGMLASLQPRLDRSTIAHAVGVEESELELIAIGHAPTAEAGARLKMLYDLAQRTDGDLSDPATLLKAAGVDVSGSRLMIPVQLVPRLKTFFIAFLVFDAILFGVLFLFLVVRA
jgi:hypothetical protein